MCDLKNAQNKAFGVESYQIHIFFRPKLKLQHFIKQMIDLFRIRYLLDIRHIFILDNKGGQALPKSCSSLVSRRNVISGLFISSLIRSIRAKFSSETSRACISTIPFFIDTDKISTSIWTSPFGNCFLGMYEVFKVRCKLFVAYASLPPHFQTKKSTEPWNNSRRLLCRESQLTFEVKCGTDTNTYRLSRHFRVMR